MTLFSHNLKNSIFYEHQTKVVCSSLLATHPLLLLKLQAFGAILARYQDSGWMGRDSIV